MLNLPNFVRRGFASEKGCIASKRKKIKAAQKNLVVAEKERIKATEILHILVTNQMLRICPQPFISEVLI